MILKGVTTLKQIKTNKPLNWMLQFFKGMMIGSGAILPGVSGGAMAAIFGLYEPAINFLSDIRGNFKKNLSYFLPIALGGLFGVFVLATPIDYALKHYPVQLLWGFIGAILGTLPSLYKEAGKKGRESKHILLTIFSALFTFMLLIYANNHLNVHMPENIFSWLFAGAMFASGLIIPGLSTSSFLIYFNLYQPLTEGIRVLDWSIIIPVAFGAVLFVLLFSKLGHKVLQTAYTPVFHFILGVVIASTAVIAPETSMYSNFSIFDYVLVLFIFLFGLFIGYWMGQLEEKYE